MNLLYQVAQMAFIFMVTDVTSYIVSTTRGIAMNTFGSLNLPLSFKSEPDVEMYNNVKVTIMGGGAFSLALSKVLSYKNITCSVLVRAKEDTIYINQHRYHPKYLSDCKIPPQVTATHIPEEALLDTHLVIHAVPVQASRKFLGSVKHLINPEVPVLSVSKGIEQETFCLMNQILEETLGKDQRCAFLSGPSFAREIMLGQATTVAIASEEEALAKELADMFSSIEFRCHTIRDVKGVELGGAIKNVIALAAGMCEGLGLGMNAMSSLVTRGCTEMKRYCYSTVPSLRYQSIYPPYSNVVHADPHSMGKLYGADPETFDGLAGVGDTFGTCLGPLSRNRQAGFRIAQGEDLNHVLKDLGGVSEGVFTALALEKMFKTKVRPAVYEFKFPIMSGVAQIIRGNISPSFGLELLMRYPIIDENRGS